MYCYVRRCGAAAYALVKVQQLFKESKASSTVLLDPIKRSQRSRSELQAQEQHERIWEQLGRR